MARYELELGDVVRRFQDAYQERFGHLMLPSHRRALNDIADCMTAAMGGGRYGCNDCDHDFWCYHGCRNRSCPKCHGRQTADWLERRTAELLPCHDCRKFLQTHRPKWPKGPLHRPPVQAGPAQLVPPPGRKLLFVPVGKLGGAMDVLLRHGVKVLLSWRQFLHQGSIQCPS